MLDNSFICSVTIQDLRDVLLIERIAEEYADWASLDVVARMQRLICVEHELDLDLLRMTIW